MSVIFFGTPDFAVCGLQALVESAEYQVRCVVTQSDKAAGRGKELKAPAVKRFASAHNIPCLQPKSIRKSCPDFMTQAESFGPFDVGVVIAFGQILPTTVLEMPAHGCINVHASLLPRWRGAAPIQRCLLAGDTETGVCLMRMEAGLDTGPVYSKHSLAVTDQTTFGSLHDELALAGANLLRRDLQRIVRGELHAVAQSEQGVTYAAKISNEEARIDWSRPGHEILRHIHGLSPFPGAFSILDGKRLKIFSAQLLETSSSRPCGALFQPDPSRLAVQVNDGAVELLEVQIEGRKRCATSDFLRGMKKGFSEFC
ncbi:MAG: methionyl-tRNA formyltransferase [Oligoflexia bacterium]|nr:methionyl-tRNA formyltransferase [Oligoflexia bacterium]